MKYKCYVCGKEIKKEPHYIGLGLYRHKLCYPGSKRWMSVTDINNKFRKYFKEVKDE